MDLMGSDSGVKIQFASVHQQGQLWIIWQVQQSIQGEEEMSERVEDEKFAGKTEYILEGELVVLLQVQDVAIPSGNSD